MRISDWSSDVCSSDLWIGDAGPWWLKVTALGVAIWLAWRFVRDYLPLRFFIPDDVTALPIWHPRRWLAGLRHAHIAWWSGKHYDKYIDREVRFLRHAQSIDEDRNTFPRRSEEHTSELQSLLRI